MYQIYHTAPLQVTTLLRKQRLSQGSRVLAAMVLQEAVKLQGVLCTVAPNPLLRTSAVSPAQSRSVIAFERMVVTVSYNEAR